MRSKLVSKCVVVVVCACLGYSHSGFAQLPDAAELAMAAKPDTDDVWWKHAVVYEIYPRSFADTNGDGIGDLNGITEHLDYLKQLGLDTLWIAPFYPSPQIDFGYDISDYRTVDPQYGTMEDFDRLLREAKKRGMHVVLDMVLNHTSDQHPFFKESASSRTNSKADWYVWNDGIPASTPNLADVQKNNIHAGPSGKVVPPNNWSSVVGGSSWEWVSERQQFYYHAHDKSQPDLNWRNPEVEKEMFSAMKFWLDKGIDGFRLDAIQALFEDSQLRNNPKGGRLFSWGFDHNQPETHDVIRRLRAMLNTYPTHPVLIGELIATTPAELDSWYGGATHDQFQLPMDYPFGAPFMITGNMADNNRLSPSYYRQQFRTLESEIHGSQPYIFFGNHDNRRSISRFGDGVHDIAIAKVLAALLLTPRATPQIYYGEEIGMPDTPPTRKEDARDRPGTWPKYKGRDGERTPMQWTPGPQAGFSTNPKTWLPISPSYKTVNVQTETADPDSLLNWYKSLVVLRSTNPSLRYGGMVIVDQANANVLSFIRTAPAGAKPVLVVMNMTSSPQTVRLNLASAGLQGDSRLHLLLSSPLMTTPVRLDSVLLPPHSIWIGSIE